MSCRLAMLLPLNDPPGEIRGMMGRNVLRQQFQSGRIAMPSVAGALKDTGLLTFSLKRKKQVKLRQTAWVAITTAHTVRKLSRTPQIPV